MEKRKKATKMALGVFSIFCAASMLAIIMTSCANDTQEEGLEEENWKEYSVNEMTFQVPAEYHNSSQFESGNTFDKYVSLTYNGNYININYSTGEDVSEDCERLEIGSEEQYLESRFLGEYDIIQPTGEYYVAHSVEKYPDDGESTNNYAVKYEDGYYFVGITVNESSTKIPEDELIQKFWESVKFSDPSKVLTPPEYVEQEAEQQTDNSQTSSETQEPPESQTTSNGTTDSGRDAVVQQFRSVLGYQEIADNYGYTSTPENAQATMDYMEQDLLDLLRPMAAGDWSNGQDGVYLALWGWIESSKQYYRSTAVEAYMNGETTYTIEQIGEMIESNDNELDNLLSEAWETLSGAISLEYEDGIQSFIDGIEG